MNPVEIVGVAFGLLSVYLTVRENIWCWPAGLVSVVAYAALFFEIKLYADMLLQAFFFITSVQGWYLWRYGGSNRSELPISFLSRRQAISMLVGLVAAVAIIGVLLDRFTDASIPFWDATISGGSVLAQLLLMRKKFENWYVWIAVDVISIGVYAYKGIYLTSGLYVVFLVLAIGGLLAWRRSLRLPTVALAV